MAALSLHTQLGSMVVEGEGLTLVSSQPIMPSCFRLLVTLQDLTHVDDQATTSCCLQVSLGIHRLSSSVLHSCSGHSHLNHPCSRSHRFCDCSLPFGSTAMALHAWLPNLCPALLPGSFLATSSTHAAASCWRQCACCLQRS